MKSRLLAGIAAVVLAVIGVVLVVSYANSADQRAVRDLEPVGVLVVTADVPAGTTVEALAASVKTQQLPSTAVSDSSLTSLDEVAGKVTSTDLVVGEQLVAERLVAPEDVQAGGTVDVPKGLQEISFQLEPQRVVGGRIVPGDHVGIIILMADGGLEDEPEEPSADLVLPKTLVTHVQGAPQPAESTAPADPAADPAAAPAEDTALPTGSLMLTVAVSDEDAVKIAFASENATMWLTKQTDKTEDTDPGTITKTEVYK